MWFKIEIKTKGEKRFPYIRFMGSSYDKENDITTIELQVFNRDLEKLYSQCKTDLNIEQFEQYLIDGNITEVYIENLNRLYTYLESVSLYKIDPESSFYGTVISDRYTKVFFNKPNINKYSDIDKFKELINESIGIQGMYSSLSAIKDRIIVLFTEKEINSLETTIRVIPRNNKTYSLKSTEFSKEIFKDICEALAHRYAVLPKPGKVKNLIVDSFLPQYFIKHKFNLENIQEEFRKNISSSATMIHRGFARMLGFRELPLDDMLTMIGYTKERIHKLLVNVRAKKFNIAFAGYGGVGTNTIYWLTELCNMSNIQGLFNKLIVTDFDTLSLDNIFRMPNPFKIFPASKHIRFNSYHSYPSNYNALHKVDTIPANSLKALSTKTPCIARMELNRNVFISSNLYKVTDWIVYGAPTIESRKRFSQILDNNITNYDDLYLTGCIKAFISATHANNICGLTINPTYVENETNLMIESYGIIQLNVFFFNQLRLAISFLEALEKYSLEELNSFRDEEFLKDYSIIDNQKSNKYNIAFQNIRTINTLENIEREA